jgi:hypothetical protein
MKKHLWILFGCAAMVLSAAQIHAGDLRLWFNAPGTNNMTQGLMLGNGRHEFLLVIAVLADNVNPADFLQKL